MTCGENELDRDLGRRKPSGSTAERQRGLEGASRVAVVHDEHGLGVAHDAAAELDGGRRWRGGEDVDLAAVGVIVLDGGEEAVVGVGESVE